jgi:hypothetical protein
MIKEREWLAVLVLVTMPAVGLGQWNATIDLNVAGADVLEVAPGESFVLTVGLDSNEGVSGVQYAFSVSAGADDALFEGLFDPTDWASYGSLFDVPFLLRNRDLFDPDDVISQLYPGPVSLDGLLPELIFQSDGGEAGGGDMGVFPASLLNYTMTAPTALDEYVLSVREAILTGSHGSIGLGSGLAVDVLHVTVTPEPGSVLLLLAAVPFLLRRRR